MFSPIENPGRIPLPCRSSGRYESPAATASDVAAIAHVLAILNDPDISPSDKFIRLSSDPALRPQADGTFYFGNLLDGQFSGFGVHLIREQGRERYVGNFRYGEKSGKGAYYYPNGDILEGTWKNDAPDGAGVFTTANGTRIQGTWRRGIFWEGNGIYVDAEGRKIRAVWDEGRIVSSEPVR